MYLGEVHGLDGRRIRFFLTVFEFCELDFQRFAFARKPLQLIGRLAQLSFDFEKVEFLTSVSPFA